MVNVLNISLAGNGIWNANRYFDLGIGVPKTFSAENWAKTALSQRHFMVSDLQNSSRSRLSQSIMICRRVMSMMITML